MASRSPQTERLCSVCGRPIPKARLEALPGVSTCVDCAKRNPPRKLTDREVDLSQSSPIDRTGFAPTD